MNALLLLLSTLCSTVFSEPGSTDHEKRWSVPLNSETGVASWYGHPYHGRPTANGEIYNMNQLTAAHPTLPFGAHVRVVNLRNQQTVEVRVNDRGPFVDGRIIDLSHAAAEAIQMVNAGVATVRLEVVDEPDSPVAVRFGIQVGAFQDRANADRCMERMRARYGAAKLSLREGDPSLWRVVVGAETSEEAARALAARIRTESGARGFLTRME
jgi:rare lipoprotein A